MSQIKYKKRTRRCYLIGEHLRKKREALGKEYKSRAAFIRQMGISLFDDEDWITEKHLGSEDRTGSALRCLLSYQQRYNKSQVNCSQK